MTAPDRFSTSGPDWAIIPFDAADPAHVAAIAAIWTGACGPDLALAPDTVLYHTWSVTGAVQAGQLAVCDGQPVGVALASAFPDDPATAMPDLGWIDAIAVLPAHQRQGIGSALLAWAGDWLRDQGCSAGQLGGSLRPFAPGLPTALGTAAFFYRRGYEDAHHTWDLAADLTDYSPATGALAVTCRPAEPGDGDALLAFWQREFPGRWRFEYQEHLREGGRLSDYLLLWTDRGVDGACLLTLENSLRPVERFFPYGLPRPWGQLGTVGVSQDRRGRGYGLTL
ncbi:MAG: GNAT family N-acetyltransferase, partial [Chloroflexi bacterium]|nr:GNAT family N-acetyltransferase [Chloroflexota bacterium]